MELLQRPVTNVSFDPDYLTLPVSSSFGEYYHVKELQDWVLSLDSTKTYSCGIGYPKIPFRSVLIRELVQKGYIEVDVVNYVSRTRSAWYQKVPVYQIKATEHGHEHLKILRAYENL